MLHNLYHLLLRKRVHLNLEPYPHPVKWKASLDRLIIWVSIFGPFSAIPQVAKIWLEREASGVSVVSWALNFLLACVWLFYGIVHKEKPIIINSSLWMCMHVLVIIGTIKYG
jgi:uncharacterized protein with PQ loop repeat